MAIEELKQATLPEEDKKYLTEEEVRAIVDGMLTNMSGNIRLLSGQISNLSKNFAITPSGATISALNAGSMPAIQGWSSTLTFSSTDADTVAWSSGSIILADGTTYTIDAGNTGNMTAITYIYIDIATSTTVLQTTTTAATSVGINKLLIAVAQNSSVEAIFQAFGGKGGLLITTDNLAADSITANEVNINTLSAIAADLGTITAGTVTGAIIQTSATGYRIKMNYATNKIELLNGNTVLASIYTDATGDCIISATDDVKFNIGGAEKIEIGSGALRPKAGVSIDIGESGNEFRFGYFDDLKVQNGYTGDVYVATSSGGSPTKKLDIEDGIVYDR